MRAYFVLPLAKTAEGIELRGRDSSRRKISSSKLLRTDKQTTAKTAVVFCRLAHLPVARSNLTLGSSPMICGGFYAEASTRRRLKTTEGIDRFSSALPLGRGIFSLFISVSTLFLHQYYVKFFIFSFKISVIFVKLMCSYFFNFAILFLLCASEKLSIRFLASQVFTTVAFYKANFAHFVRRALEGVNTLLGSIERYLR